jgi:hypothetical protein
MGHSPARSFILQQTGHIQLLQSIGDDLIFHSLTQMLAKGFVDLLRAACTITKEEHLCQGRRHDYLILCQLQRIAQIPHLLTLVIDWLEIKRA